MMEVGFQERATLVPCSESRRTADADERAGTALFAVSVRSIGRVGRTTTGRNHAHHTS